MYGVQKNKIRKNILMTVIPFLFLFIVFLKKVHRKQHEKHETSGVIKLTLSLHEKHLLMLRLRGLY